MLSQDFWHQMDTVTTLFLQNLSRKDGGYTPDILLSPVAHNNLFSNIYFFISTIQVCPVIPYGDMHYMVFVPC